MIAVVTAMTNEASEIISHLNLVKEKPFAIYTGKVHKHHICLIISGVGKVNAAMATTHIIGLYNPRLIINLGLAGAHQLEYGQSYLIKNACYHDFDLTLFGYEAGQVPKYPAVFHSANLSGLPFEKTNLYTGDYFSVKTLDNKPYLADMEGAAIFQVAYQYKIDVVSVKTVSDIIGDSEQHSLYNHAEGHFAMLIYDNLLEILKVIK